MSKDKVMASCFNCNAKFEKKRKHHKFCSTKCRVEYWYKTNVTSKKIKSLEDRINKLEEKSK